MIDFAATRKGTTGVTVGGGLLGLEAAKAMMDLEDFGKVKLIERNRWVLSRQLDGDAGGMVVEQVTALGLDVMLSKRVGKIEVDEENHVKGVVFEDGESMECSTICFAVCSPSTNPQPSKLQTNTTYRSASNRATSSPENAASSAPTAAAASSSHPTSRLPPQTSTLSASAPAGRTRRSG